MAKLKPIFYVFTASALLFGCATDTPPDSGSKNETDAVLYEPTTSVGNIESEEDMAQTQGSVDTSTAAEPGLIGREVARAEEHRLLEKKVQPSTPALQESFVGLAAKAVIAAPAPMYDAAGYPVQVEDRENYEHLTSNPIHLVSKDPVSTFSIDVDTQSYSNVRRILNQGSLPRTDAVKAEELINYFAYDYPLPTSTEVPFSVSTEVAPSPWSDNYLLHIGIKGYEKPAAELPPSNLVFLIDVSGSMQSPNKLGLVQKSLRLLVNQMTPKDTLAIVVYAGAEGLVLPPTSGAQKAQILNKIDQLSAGGSTNGGAGIRLAYQVAEGALIKDGINRVILASDGDFNVGTTNINALKDLVAKKRQSGVGLTTLAYGVGNTNFHLMEQLADTGDGHAAYIDTLQEANKVLVNEMSSTLMTIAKDVKIQIEFNPEVVKEYRLIGYENRLLRQEDFKNDKIDAGEIGAGHTVTAVYEVTLQNSESALIDPLRYQSGSGEAAVANSGSDLSNELAFLKLRFKHPGNDHSQELRYPINRTDSKADLAETSANFRFSTAVAGFAQLLQGGAFIRNDFAYRDVLALANLARGQDPFGYRGEFIQLVNLAASLATPITDNQPPSRG